MNAPRYEIDTLGWIADALSDWRGADGHPSGLLVRAEVLAGHDDTILLCFPSGGRRYLYLDDGHEPRRLQQVAIRPVSVEEVEYDDALNELDDLRAERDSAQDVIRDARALLDAIMEGDRGEGIPDWLRDNLGTVLSKLD